MYAARTSSTFFKVGSASSTGGLISQILQYQITGTAGWSFDTLTSTQTVAYRDYAVGTYTPGYTPATNDVVLVSLNSAPQYVVSGRPLTTGYLEITVMISPQSGTQTVHSTGGGVFNVVIFQFL